MVEAISQYLTDQEHKLPGRASSPRLFEYKIAVAIEEEGIELDSGP
jgi:hypothetical protein